MHHRDTERRLNMMSLGSKGQGDSLIKLLVVAIIAVIALAMVKSYFREASRATKKSVEEIFTPVSTALTETLVSPSLVPLVTPVS